MKKYYHRSEIPNDMLEYFEEVEPELSRCVVLDPFMGSGTTAIVAQSLGRDYIGIDLNKDYIEMAERRIVKAKQKETPKKQKENNKRFENIDMKER